MALVSQDEPIHLGPQLTKTGFRFGCACGWFITWLEESDYENAMSISKRHGERHRAEVVAIGRGRW